ncbi:helix-turn-helix transcriptional regulator [Cohnella rhizosphaerae]|uniref:AraC family transcriptional regulator n=1 Tax=Cohnella rhizosphaerae TaxID=1457232 RepID=A0A9X4KS64_9BACL|nr:AraC family transcriptional regulator [Cohnella rhizosphaerae]MDG0809925.1 AraC family transcriptional regulator [Cohnella rhizosphaerae]
MRHSIIAGKPEILSGSLIHGSKESPFYFPLHQHELNGEIFLITEGEGEFRVDGRFYRAKAGSLLMYNRGIWHEERSTSDKFAAVYVAYAGLQLQGMPADCLSSAAQPAMLELGEHFLPVKKLFVDMIEEWSSPLPESAFVANGLLHALTGRLARLLHYSAADQVKKRPHKETVHLARRYMEENYPFDVTLETLASLTYTNPYHFIHVFKAETGMSPIQYLIRYRIEVAKQYLASTRLPMAEIAEKVGYKSETYFQNLFKKTTGMSPGKYRTAAGGKE